MKKTIILLYFLICGTSFLFGQSDNGKFEIEPPIISCGPYDTYTDLIETMPIYGNCADSHYSVTDCSEKNVMVSIQREAKRMNIESPKTKSTAYINFYVEEDGSVQEAIIAKSCGIEKLDSAALKLIMKLQDWQAAEYKGVPKRTVMVIPVNFK